MKLFLTELCHLLKSLPLYLNWGFFFVLAHFPALGSGTPKPSTPTPTNTPCSTPHPADFLSAPLSVTPTPSDPPMVQSQSQPALLTPFAQQQLALSQPLPVMTIPLPTMGTSITTGTTSSQVMANPAGLNFINVVSSVW